MAQASFCDNCCNKLAFAASFRKALSDILSCDKNINKSWLMAMGPFNFYGNERALGHIAADNRHNSGIPCFFRKGQGKQEMVGFAYYACCLYRHYGKDCHDGRNGTMKK